MPLDLGPSFLARALSGIALATLGATLLRVAPRRADALALGGFALLWGAQVVAASLFRSDPSVVWYTALAVLLLPLPAPLLLFVRSIAPSGRAMLAWAAGAFAIGGGFAALAVLSAPARFFDPVTFQASPVLLVAFVVNGVAVFGVVTAIAGWAYLHATEPQRRDHLALVTAALATYASYNAARNLRAFGGDGTALVLGVRVAATLAVVIVLAAIAWHVIRLAELPRRALVLLSIALPASMALAEFVLALAGIAVDTLGIWRLWCVALLAYAVARRRLFDVELRLKAAAPGVAYVLLILVAFYVIALGWSDVWAARPILLLPALAGILATFAPAPRLVRGWVERAAPHVRESDDYIYQRKLEVYRGALEDSATRGTAQTETQFLDELRRGLGVSEEEHRVLVMLIRSQDRAPKPGMGNKLGVYRVERELGRGGFGRAVLAHDTALDRKVVLKQPLAGWVLDADGRARFLEEARLAARVQHPNLVSVFGIDESQSPPVLAMEYVAGGSLKERLESAGALDVESAAGIVLGVLDGLAAVHRAGIIHRDLKPANILLDEAGRAKVADFGIAQRSSQLVTTITGGAGSLAYMSPEQLRGGPASEGSDLHAVGVVLFESLTGVHPFAPRGAPEAQARNAILRDPPPLPDTRVPPAFEAVLRKVLQKEPRDRYASAQEMHAALAAALSATRSASRTPSRT